MLPTGSQSEEAALVKSAYHFASKAHNGRFRASSEEYLEHDLAVARDMIQLGAEHRFHCRRFTS